MDIKVKEVNGQLVCQKYNHNKQIIIIVMEESLPISERFLCVKCVQSNRTVFKTLGINQVKELIKEKSGQQEQQITQQRAKKLIKNKRVSIENEEQEIQIISQQWINEYDKEEDDTQLVNLIKGLELLNQKNQQKDNESIGWINQSYFIKLSHKLKKMINSMKDLSQPYDLLKQLQFKSNQSQQKQLIQQKEEHIIFVKALQEQKIQNQSDNNQTKSQIQLINSIKQLEWCWAIAFNNNGQMMVTGCKQDIKVWKFEKGQIIEKKKLNGHTQDVWCLVFSKKIDWFASGSQDNTIRCWKEQTNGEWISTQPESQHTYSINCLLLNSNEDELISCSNDNTIKVWKVNCQSNQIDYNYTLVQIHTDCVYCISMNEQETYLASCSEDKKIILWNKDNKNKWKYQNEIRNDDFGCRLCFISDYQIIWQQQGKGITYFFEIKNENLMKRPELNIQLNQESDDQAFFPTIFNKRKQIIVQSHNKYVYFLKKQENDKLTLAKDPIDCSDKWNYGSLTDDGEYLVVWNQGTKEFRVHQINYK